MPLLGDCQEWLASVALLQLLIASVAWAGMLLASCHLAKSVEIRSFSMGFHAFSLMFIDFEAFLCSEPWFLRALLGFDDFSFVPMDRHLNKGLRHLLDSPAARRCFLHEFLSHCVAQLVFADLLRRRASSWRGALAGAAAIQVVYALLVLGTAMLVPPHALPYNLGRVPKRLQCPLSLPKKLYGDGASERAKTSFHLFSSPFLILFDSFLRVEG